MKKRTSFLATFLLVFSGIMAQNYPTPIEGDFVIENFEFEKGKTLEKLNLHYRMIGAPKI